MLKQSEAESIARKCRCGFACDTPELERAPSTTPAGVMVYNGDLFFECRGDLFVPAR
jgi:glucose/arabinose dehydrogenase